MHLGGVFRLRSRVTFRSDATGMDEPSLVAQVA